MKIYISSIQIVLCWAVFTFKNNLSSFSLALFLTSLTVKFPICRWYSFSFQTVYQTIHKLFAYLLTWAVENVAFKIGFEFHWKVTLFSLDLHLWICRSSSYRSKWNIFMLECMTGMRSVWTLRCRTVQDCQATLLSDFLSENLHGAIWKQCRAAALERSACWISYHQSAN